jgi:hypothetical protein
MNNNETFEEMIRFLIRGINMSLYSPLVIPSVRNRSAFGQRQICLKTTGGRGG